MAEQVFDAVVEGGDHNFSEEEKKIQGYWEDIKAFETSYARSLKEGRPAYTFYDGPPFATGKPHYGHILAGTIKDVVTRYAHQTGHSVLRRFGWDCHGLPVEFIIDKKLDIKGPEDVERIGIKAYNAECRSIVMTYASQWEEVVKRMGRWIDFKNDYKTLDKSFMETVWWVFQQMWEKKLVYQGFKVMPYSTACSTPLSNFEAGLEYKDVSDPAIVVSFPVLSEDPKFAGASFVAWTTTPWTLPSNLGLCVNADLIYVKVKDKNSRVFILAKVRLEEVYPSKKGKKKEEAVGSEEYDIVAEFPGKDLVGLKYKPLFDVFADEYKDSAFVVVADGYVTSDAGTGIVHLAPAFGEEDYRVCVANKIVGAAGGRFIKVPCPVDSAGRFTSELQDKEIVGKLVKEADRLLIAKIKETGRLVKNNQIVHSYPHCWRSHTPLIYKAVPSWFVDVPSIRDRLLKNNAQTYWVPSFVKEKRFHNWLESAKEWAVSRNRYWGTPLPIWIAEDDGKSDSEQPIIVIGSVAELEKLAKLPPGSITDLHRDSIDDIIIEKDGRKFKRTTEVFDCWFESGSMPYAQLHYPFENKEAFADGFPADFIAEGLDQTRGWFYTLMVIGTALFDKPPFKNLIVNGLVLAEDGKKMSKSAQNYPDPMKVVGEYGADALRVYLMSSPVVRAEPLCFTEKGVKDVVKDVLIPWFNTFKIFIAQSRQLQRKYGVKFVPDPKVFKKSSNVLDKWILSALQGLIASFKTEMDRYMLFNVLPHLLKFLDQFSRWYIRFNKLRMKSKTDSETATQEALQTLQVVYEVLTKLCVLMAPFTPFFVEYLYQRLKKALPADKQEDSVHYLMIPEPDPEAINLEIETRVSRMQKVMELGRSAREKSGQISYRFPYPKVLVIHRSEEFLEDVKKLSDYVVDELNVKSLELSSKLEEFITLSIKPVEKVLGPLLGAKRRSFEAALEKLTAADLIKMADDGSMNIAYKHESEELKFNAEVGLHVELIYNFKGNEVPKKEEPVEDAGDDESGKKKKKSKAKKKKDEEKKEDKPKQRFVAASERQLVVVVDTELNEECYNEGLAREIISKVQLSRKELGFSIEDKLDLFIGFGEGESKVKTVYALLRDYIEKKLDQQLQPVSDISPADVAKSVKKEYDVLKEPVAITIVKRS